MKLLFEGTISTKSILQEGKRECFVLYVDKKKRNKDIGYILSLAKKKKVPIQLVNKEELDRLTNGSKHGGIVLEAGPRNYLKLEEKMDVPFFYVNGIEDPYNFGSTCRTLYALGFSHLVILDRDWSNAEPIIQKASAGAYEKMDIYGLDTDSQLVSYCQDYNIPLYCAHRNKAMKATEMEWNEVFCLAVGGAMRGLSSVLVNASAQNIYIPYGNEFRNALDTPSAISILAYEIQRSKL